MQSMENCVNIWCEDTCLWIFMGLFFSYTSWKFFWVSPHSSDAMQRNGAVENSTYDSLSLSHSYHLPKWRQSQVISHDDNSICSFWVLELAYFHLIEGVRQWCQEPAMCSVDCIRWHLWRKWHWRWFGRQLLFTASLPLKGDWSRHLAWECLVSGWSGKLSV